MKLYAYFFKFKLTTPPSFSREVNTDLRGRWSGKPSSQTFPWRRTLRYSICFPLETKLLDPFSRGADHMHCLMTVDVDKLTDP